jgi:hypothetical protein
MDKTQKDVCIVVMAHQDAAEILQPCKQVLNFPTTIVCIDALDSRTAWLMPVFCCNCVELSIQCHVQGNITDLNHASIVISFIITNEFHS